MQVRVRVRVAHGDLGVSPEHRARALEVLRGAGGQGGCALCRFSRGDSRAEGLREQARVRERCDVAARVFLGPLGVVEQSVLQAEEEGAGGALIPIFRERSRAGTQLARALRPEGSHDALGRVYPGRRGVAGLLAVEGVGAQDGGAQARVSLEGPRVAQAGEGEGEGQQ